MKLKIDHDYHIHSFLSSCSNDPLQTPETILEYAKKNHYSKICLTNHFWDNAVPGASDWYKPQNFAHISSALPLPQDENVTFYFGAETDMDMHGRLGIKKETISRLDFLIVATTHFHMEGFTIPFGIENPQERSKLWVSRFEDLLQMQLPFEKIGIAHLTCPTIYSRDKNIFLQVIDSISSKDLNKLFEKSALLKMGIELNFNPFNYTDKELKIILRPYHIAKQKNCKFYFGSDAHHPNDLLSSNKKFIRIAELLETNETDIFNFTGR